MMVILQKKFHRLTYGDRSNGSINSLVANRTDQLIHPKMIVLIIGATSFIVL